MVSGPDEQYDAVGYDWDGDGKAEVLMRGADNMIIHHPDGTTTEIGNMKTNTRNTVNQTDANAAYTNYGNEYLLYMEGATAKPYPIGTNGALWMTYPLPRGNASDWATATVTARRSTTSALLSSTDVTPTFSWVADATPNIT